MRKIILAFTLLTMPFLLGSSSWAELSSKVVFETTSVYHHIKVIDENGTRTLSFDGSMETRMSLDNPLTGHFEYTEYFQMPFLWNNHIKNVAMIGLGGGSTQRAYQYYYPDVNIDTVDIDPAVVDVAKEYFNVKESPTHKIHVMDGRVYLRRAKTKYDVIIMDAYTSNRYGSYIPFHLATKEFFQIANDHMTDNGVLAYNVIGTIYGWRADILGALYKTLKEVFPQVYMFPANESQNVVLIATKSAQKYTKANVLNEVNKLLKTGRMTNPQMRARTFVFSDFAPGTANRSPVLTDDFAPTDGLLRTGKK